MKYPSRLIQLFFCVSIIGGLTSCKQEGSINPPMIYDVIVYGSGTGAIAAGIQSARGGAQTLLISPSPWLGGMLSTAGVSATDGNHKLPSGLWGEFRERIYRYYGGPDSVFTGWVSNTNFEPHVADQIWKQFARQTSGLTILYEYSLQRIIQQDPWQIQLKKENQIITTQSIVLIDGTDLGDLLPVLNIEYDLGWEQDLTGPDHFLPGKDYIQDLTYCAILKDYKAPQEVTAPAGYTPEEFYCACKYQCDQEDIHDCELMLNYARLPNHKYLLNWPIQGNDLYPTLDIFDSDKRNAILEQAKLKTMRFAYYIHKELGYSNLWLADDEFDTPDLLPYDAYYREARRMRGKTRFTIKHILEPYAQNLYRTGIAVGDYPVDHHHDEYPQHVNRASFPKIPSFTIPVGVLIPANFKNLLVADKSISVTHEANGTTRLQPVIIQIGQAAGALAALTIDRDPANEPLSVRDVQAALLNHQVYLQPYLDVPSNDPAFKSIQKIGSTGILRGIGIPFQWANQTWFYPDTTINTMQTIRQIKELIPTFKLANLTDTTLNVGSSFIIAYELKKLIDPAFQQSKTTFLSRLQRFWDKYSVRPFDPFMPITKQEFALLLDEVVDPFFSIPINNAGNVIYENL